MSYYYLKFDDKKHGPFTASELREFWGKGKITAVTPYIQPGWLEYRPIGALMAVLLLTPGPSRPIPMGGIGHGSQLSSPHSRRSA